MAQALRQYEDPNEVQNIFALKNVSNNFISDGYHLTQSESPIILFAIDVSKVAVYSGILKFFIETIKGLLCSTVGNDKAMVGFLTFDDDIHFYSIENEITEPIVLILYHDEEIEYKYDIINLLVSLQESIIHVESFLDLLAYHWVGTEKPIDTLNVVLQVANIYVLLDNGCKLLMFILFSSNE